LLQVRFVVKVVAKENVDQGGPHRARRLAVLRARTIDTGEEADQILEPALHFAVLQLVPLSAG